MLLSVVVPVGPKEPAIESWASALDKHLKGRLEPYEIVLSIGENSWRNGQTPFTVVKSAWGRAQQLNAGAFAAKGDALWFLHVDSKISDEMIRALEENVNGLQDDEVKFFRLGFDSTSWKMRLNEWGVRLRSECFGIPFGDQSLLISKKGFNRVGAFDENLPFAEDHSWIWEARRAGFRLSPIKKKLVTSARKYEEKGWVRVTASHLWLTYAQIWREIRK